VASAIAPFAAAGSPSPGSVGAPIFDASLEVPLQYMDRNTFIPLIGTRFMVHTTTSRTVPLTLIAVEDTTAIPHSSLQRGHGRSLSMVGNVPAASTRHVNTFALRFRGPVGKTLAQDSYIFESGSLGRIAMFIVPGGNAQGKGLRAPTYTAIFSRLQ